MVFLNDRSDVMPLDDAVYSALAKAKADRSPEVLNATVGTFCGEDGKIAVLRTVYDTFDAIPDGRKAAYASGILGSREFRDAVTKWITPAGMPPLASCAFAAPGGTGAVNAVMTACLEKGMAVIVPSPAWTSYDVMAEANGFAAVHYRMFENGEFTLRFLKEAVNRTAWNQKRIVICVNDPCHNPTGYSMKDREWEELISFLNEISAEHDVILINDIAYADYSFDTKHVHDYMRTWGRISDRVLIAAAFSCSKTLTAYGMRCGAAVLFAKNASDIRTLEAFFEKRARAAWSSVNAAAMETFVTVTSEKKEAYLAEKKEFISLLKQRSYLFLKEAKKASLPVYPYREGFFVTLLIEDDEKCRAVHSALMEEHIYTVLAEKGIRIGICSLPLAKIEGLAEKIRKIEDRIL